MIFVVLARVEPTCFTSNHRTRLTSFALPASTPYFTRWGCGASWPLPALPRTRTSPPPSPPLPSPYSSRGILLPEAPICRSFTSRQHRRARPSGSVDKHTQFKQGRWFWQSPFLSSSAYPSARQETCFFGLVKQRTVDGTNGRVLCSGFWGMSRHVNYLGEIVQVGTVGPHGLGLLVHRVPSFFFKSVVLSDRLMRLFHCSCRHWGLQFLHAGSRRAHGVSNSWHWPTRSTTLLFSFLGRFVGCDHSA